ncbi:NUDIX domain-containing protein [Actinoplanes sp. NPDC051859]|uniref:NUDIX domain-containing protein n=1 Tax=Actinoplanes sp. NPDC051859 TaxID=3363909 RepID=UPI00378976D8
MSSAQAPATPRVAAGALFLDRAGRVLVVRSSHAEHWEIPGGYVEPGESPRAACARKIREELGLSVRVGAHLVVDWDLADAEGDKLLFIFDAGTLETSDGADVPGVDREFVDPEELVGWLPARLTRRVHAAIEAKARGSAVYTENGDEA